MRFYCLTPSGVPENPVLFPLMRDTFEANGNVFVDRIEEAECVLFDLHTRIAEYKQKDIDWLCQSNVPCIDFCEYDRGGLSSEIWPDPLTEQQWQVFSHVEKNNIKSAHFCRLLDKTWKHYQKNLFPYEKPLLYEEPITDANELFSRIYDVCLIANTSPARENIVRAFREDRRFSTLFKIGEQKIPFDQWVACHKEAKLFISASGGGYSNERPQNLFSIAGMIQEETDQLLLHPHAHLKTCIKISSTPTKAELDTIHEIVNNKEKLYEIYKNNYNFMKTYYSKEYIAQNILDTILKHL